MTATELYAAVLAAPDDDAPRLAMADYLDARGDVYGRFIRAQLAQAAASRAGDRRAAQAAGKTADELLAHAGDPYRGDVAACAKLVRYARGFVEYVLIDAPVLIAQLDHLRRTVPLRQVAVVNAIPVLDAVLALPGLAHVRALNLSSDGGKLGDAGAVKLAAAPHLRGLRSLELAFHDIGEPGLDALCASPNLRGLVYCNFAGNRVASPVAPRREDWASGTSTGSADLPPAGAALEAKYGRIAWLHAASLLPNLPPTVHDI